MLYQAHKHLTLSPFGQYSVRRGFPLFFHKSIISDCLLANKEL